MPSPKLRPQNFPTGTQRTDDTELGERIDAMQCARSVPELTSWHAKFRLGSSVTGFLEIGEPHFRQLDHGRPHIHNGRGHHSTTTVFPSNPCAMKPGITTLSARPFTFRVDSKEIGKTASLVLPIFRYAS